MEKVSDKITGIPLLSIKSGEKCEVAGIITDDRTKLRKLAAFGIFPGVMAHVIQKYPAVVIQIGFTQVALDDEIASQILVKP